MSIRIASFATAIALAMILSTEARAQTTIQLPTFNYTTAATTVMVPDQGSAFIGGVSRAQDGRSQFGVPILGKVPGLNRGFNNVGIGQTRSATNLSVRAQIHDFDAMDQALLQQAAGQRSSNVAGAAGRLPGAVAGVPAALSVAEAERARSDEAANERLEVANLMQKAQAAEADGRTSVAKIYYRIVARDAGDSPLRAMAQERLAVLSGRGTSKLAAAGLGPTR